VLAALSRRRSRVQIPSGPLRTGGRPAPVPGQVAQSVERAAENRKVGGSIPSLPTRFGLVRLSLTSASPRLLLPDSGILPSLPLAPAQPVVSQEGFQAYERLCELARIQSLAKGSRVVVVGRLQQRTWTAEDGSARSVVEVVAEELGSSLRWATATPVKATRNADE
jgi:single-stranded DNA-binding protein